MSKRRKFVADGVFYAELNEFFQRELAEEGYSGVEVRVTPTVTDISTFFRLFFEIVFVDWMVGVVDWSGSRVEGVIFDGGWKNKHGGKRDGKFAGQD